MELGIDVSHWQDDKSTAQKMDFKKAVKNGAKFVFIKVSERGALDSDFEYNWQAAKDAGLLRGGYHFLRWDLSGLMQARIFSEILQDDPGELPPVADFEAPRSGSLYPSNRALIAIPGGSRNQAGPQTDPVHLPGVLGHPRPQQIHQAVRRQMGLLSLVGGALHERIPTQCQQAQGHGTLDQRRQKLDLLAVHRQR